MFLVAMIVMFSCFESKRYRVLDVFFLLLRYL